MTKNIFVEGHSCDLGDEDYDGDFSKRRAENVKQALVSAGIPENKIVVHHYGETMFGKAGYGQKRDYRRVQICLNNKRGNCFYRHVR